MKDLRETIKLSLIDEIERFGWFVVGVRIAFFVVLVVAVIAYALQGKPI